MIASKTGGALPPAAGEVTGLSALLATKADLSGGKVPSDQLPSYVDDVLEAADFAALPGSGETGKIYITLDTSKTYRWSGSAYVLLNDLPAFASQAEAEAGSNNTKLMTPLRTAQAIAELGGGGGGSSLVRGFGVLHGNTTDETPPQNPPYLDIVLTSTGPWVIVLRVNGADWVFNFCEEDPGDAGLWIDPSSLHTTENYAEAFASAVSGAGITNVYASWNGNNTLTVYHNGFGGYETLYVANPESTPGINVYGGGSGADGSPGYGAVTYVDIIPAASGKTTKPVRVQWCSADHGVPYEVQVVLAGVNVLLGTIPAMSTSGELTINPDVLVGWNEGCAEASLSAYYNDTPTYDPSTLTIFAIAEQG